MFTTTTRLTIAVRAALACSLVLSPILKAVETEHLEEIVVTGARLQNLKTIDIKRNTQQIADLVSADDIGKQPDFNIGDALKRVAGVSTIPEEDEGQFISIRGINPDLTWVTMDGAAIASASQGESRRVSMEFFPASLVSALQVIKSRTPDIDGNTIGGQVNLKTKSALANKGFHAVSTAMVGRFSADKAPVGLDDKSGDNKMSWRFDSTISNTFGDNNQFGLVLAGSYFAKDRDEERIIPISFRDTEGFNNPNSRYAPNLTIWSTYNNPIDRYGLFSKFEYQASESISMLLQAQRFHQEDYARRESEILSGGQADFVSADSGRVTGASLALGLDEFEAENTYTGIQYELHYEEQSWLADLRLSSSSGEFYQDSPDIDFNGTQVDYRYQYDSGTPYITFEDPQAALNPDNHSLLRIQPFMQDYDNSVDEVEANLGYGYNQFGWGVKTGFKYRQANQSFSSARDTHNYIGGSATLTDFFIATDYQLLFREGVGSLFADGTGVMQFLKDNPGQFESEQSQPKELYSVDEDVAAVYLSASYVAEQYEAVFGVRYETTDVTSTAGAETQDGDYANLLPSVLVSYNLTDDMLLRLSYAKALGRANIGDLKISTIEDPAAAVLSVTGGNPALEPRKSDNFDISWEYYFAEGNMLSVALFHKAIENEIFKLSTTGTYQGREALLTLPKNASDSSLTGVELGVIVNQLPGLLKDFGFSFNYTFIDAETTLLDLQGKGTKVGFVFEQPEHIANATLFYQRDAFEAQLSLNYSDNYHAGFAGDPGFTDEFDAYQTLDFQARYDLTDNLVLIGEVRNITEEPLERRTGPNLKLLNDKSEFGRSVFIGATLKF